ncbi:MAG TPA: immunity 26/phosphotriesterase HocA family protein [Thermoanaerobaculia bacterium]|nr:immunity 26/phosphotriesterase HocA family protein [Thermoanaerobaculia bacterium]
MKRQRRREGDLVAIDLRDGTQAFARVLKEPLMAFYDLRVGNGETPDLQEILTRPILWKIWVMNHAMTSGRWKVLAHIPLEQSLQREPAFFKQDPLSGEVTLYRSQTEYPSSAEDCEQLERAAVWEPEHAEDRLRDHFAGRPNQWVESLRVKRGERPRPK